MYVCLFMCVCIYVHGVWTILRGEQDNVTKLIWRLRTLKFWLILSYEYRNLFIRCFWGWLAYQKSFGYPVRFVQNMNNNNNNQWKYVKVRLGFKKKLENCYRFNQLSDLRGFGSRIEVVNKRRCSDQ